MASPFQTTATGGAHIVVVGTGGTIAGTAASARDQVGYCAAQLGVEQLVAAVPDLATWPLECVQVAQLDSKDMSHAAWQRLAQEVARQLLREDVTGIVITHGTDTLEETAYFLWRVLQASKPVVLTASMRPATALQADGPQNLLDAVQLAATPGACGVMALLGGVVHGAADLRKIHTHRIDAFSSGDAGPLAQIEAGSVRQWRPWVGVTPPPFGLELIEADSAQWPRVALLPSHAGLDAALVQAQVEAWCRIGLAGLVVVGTGNGTLHGALEPALRQAAAAGVTVWRASRCAFGAVLSSDGSDIFVPPAEAAAAPVTTSAAPIWPASGPCTAVQARIELMLRLLEKRRQMQSVKKPEEISLRTGNWAVLGADAGAVRTEVFIGEQQIPIEMEWDEADADPTTLHTVAYNRQGRAIGTSRLLVHAPGVGRIGRMAVRASHRGRQVGRRMLDALLEAAVERGDRVVILYAQVSAQGFYQRAGFVERGSRFEEAGIPHVEMVRALRV